MLNPRVGINVPRDGSVSAAEVAALHAGFVRIVLTTAVDLRPILSSYHAAGIKVLAVIARESTLVGADTCTFYAQRHAGQLDWVQVCNEPDSTGPSSWTMSQSDLATWIFQAHAAFGSTPLIGPGLASGNPSWLQGVPSAALGLLSGIAVHPYGQRPSADWPSPSWGVGTLDDLLAGYARFQQPIWITEFGTEDLTVQASYASRMLEVLLARPTIMGAFWFCWSDAPTGVGSFGLVAANGTMKPSYFTFANAASPKEAPVAAPQFVLGFAQYAKDHAAEVGTPLENEFPCGPNFNVQPTSRGMLIYDKTDNSTEFKPLGKA